jgi:hypothetical protein
MSQSLQPSRGGRPSVQNFLESVINYVEGKHDQIDEESVSSFFSAIRQGRQILGSYLVAVAFKEMKHLVALLDALHLAEEKLFSKEVIEKADLAELKRLQGMISLSVGQTFNMLMQIANKMEGRNLRDFEFPKDLLVGGTYLTTPELAAGAIRRAHQQTVEAIPKERREKLRNVLEKILEKHPEILDGTGERDSIG